MRPAPPPPRGDSTPRNSARLSQALQLDDDARLFLREAMKRPQAVSALVPSSQKLAAAMASQVPSGHGPVVELGPGTGKITREILAHGVSPRDLHLVEVNDQFVTLLKNRFPESHVHHCGAEAVSTLHLPPLRAVVSGLPMLSFPARLQARILRSAFRSLAPGAPFIQYTYGPTVPVSGRVMRALGLQSRRSSIVWGNLPPAQVLLLQRATR